mgnify:CR=1 FL=1
MIRAQGHLLTPSELRDTAVGSLKSFNDFGNEILKKYTHLKKTVKYTDI